MPKRAKATTTAARPETIFGIARPTNFAAEHEVIELLQTRGISTGLVAALVMVRAEDSRYRFFGRGRAHTNDEVLALYSSGRHTVVAWCDTDPEVAYAGVLLVEPAEGTQPTGADLWLIGPRWGDVSREQFAAMIHERTATS